MLSPVPQKHFDTPSKSVALDHHPAIRKNSHRPCLTAGLLGMRRVTGSLFDQRIRVITDHGEASSLPRHCERSEAIHAA
jgi:hypothetical protein